MGTAEPVGTADLVVAAGPGGTLATVGDKDPAGVLPAAAEGFADALGLVNAPACLVPAEPDPGVAAATVAAAAAAESAVPGLAVVLLHVCADCAWLTAGPHAAVPMATTAAAAAAATMR